MLFTKKLKSIKIPNLYTSRTFFSAIFLSILLFCFLFFNASPVDAATLGISPESVTTSVGKTIAVKVVVGTAGQSVNAISGQINYPNNLLTLTSITKGNLITLWAQDPTYSNASGSATFQGVILNGYKGDAGSVITLIFKAKNQGTANISIASSGSSVLLNDGQGTNALTGTTGGTIKIAKAEVIAPPVVVPPPVQEPTPVFTPPVTTPPPVLAVPDRAPIFTDYQSPAPVGTFVVVKGTTTPDSTVRITFTQTLADGSTTVTETTLPTNDAGVFTFVSESKVTEGSSFILVATTKDGQHTDPLKLSSKVSFWSDVGNVIEGILAVKISLVLALFILLLIVGYLVYRNLVLREKVEELLRELQHEHEHEHESSQK